jgi:hypothetical protein
MISSGAQTVRQDGLKYKDKQIDEDEVKSVIKHELDHALGHDGGTFSDERRKAIEYYEGAKLGTEVEGRSTVVMRSVLEAVEWVLPALIRIFTASDKICVVEPTRPEQEAVAKIATDYMNVIFHRDNNGFAILHDWFKDALLEKLGWTKYWWDTQIIKEIETYSGLTKEQYDALLDRVGPIGSGFGDYGDGDEDADEQIVKIEVIEEESYDQMPGGWGLDRAVPPEALQSPVPPPPPGALAGASAGALPAPAGIPGSAAGISGPPAGIPQGPLGAPMGDNVAMFGGPPMPPPPPQPITLYDCTLRVVKQRRRVRIENVPPEEVLFSRRAKRGQVPFLAHKRLWTYSDLIEQDYDEDCLEDVPSYTTEELNSERVARHRLEDDLPGNERKDAGKEVWVEENYVRLDLYGDGTTELYKVVTANGGSIILTKDGEPDIECVEQIPFVSLCPVPMPHKLVGLSLADLTMDLQLIKSTLFRQMLDNAYLSNWPRLEIGDDVVNENTYDDIMTHRPGGAIRTKRVGGLQAMAVPFTADKTFPLMEYIDQTQEVRTGVARHNQGINPDDLNKTATGVSLLQQAAAQRVELFARIFAIGVEELMRGVMGLVRRHQQQERVVRFTGGFFPVNPRTWQDELQVRVSVGLGTGNRDQILQQLMQILQAQQGIVQVQGGVSGPLVYAKNVYDVLNKLTENAGFTAEFFHDPTKPPDPATMGPQQQKGPDPAQAQAQAVVQATQLKAQATVQAVQMKAQAEQVKAQQQAQVDATLQQQRAQLEADLQQKRLDHDLAMERDQTMHKMLLEKQEAEHRRELQMQEMMAKIALAQKEVELKAAAGAYDPPPPRMPPGNGSGHAA